MTARCPATYERPTGRDPGDRIVECHLQAGHPGEHEEAGTDVTWLNDEPEPFDPATMCHPNPQVSGGDGCPNIDPCKLRCHLRYLEDWPQPNDWLFNGARESRGSTR